jgi:hypothetical protein
MVTRIRVGFVYWYIEVAAAVGSFSKEIHFPGSALADRGTEIC